MTDFDVGTYAEKIRKLLDKAESTDSEHEREALTERAMALMEKYAIDEAMIASAKPVVTEELITKSFDFTGRFAKANRMLTSAIARNFNCRSVVYDMDGYYDPKPHKFRIKVHGFQSDVERVALLDASLQIQCSRALRAWEKEQGWRFADLPQWEKFKDRRSFRMSFASGVSSKLLQARKTAAQEAASERAAAAGTTEASESAGVELVLRDRKDRVNDWFDSLYGNSLRHTKSRVAAGGWGASNAGYAAGQRADTGQGGLGGTKKSLGR